MTTRRAKRRDRSSGLRVGWGWKFRLTATRFITSLGPSRKLISAGYKQARWGARDSYYTPQSSLDWFSVDCHEISTKEKENVGGWVRSDCRHVLTFHGIGDEQDGWEPISVAEFARQIAQLPQHQDSGAVEVVTFKDGADRLRGRNSAPPPPASSLSH